MGGGNKMLALYGVIFEGDILKFKLCPRLISLIYATLPVKSRPKSQNQINGMRSIKVVIATE